MTGRDEVMVWAACLIAPVPSFAPARAAEGGKAFTVAADEFGPVYRVDMEKVRSAADLTAVPGVKIAWDLHGGDISLLANACDWDGDGKIDLIAGVETKGNRRIVRYKQDGRRIWSSEQVNTGLGSESGLAVEDLDGDGRYEVTLNVSRQLWCLDADTGKTKWKIDLPACRDNYQASVVGHFLDRKRFAVVCRVYRDVTCYDAAGKKVWTYRIENKSLYGHEMAHYDADGDGLDEVYVSLTGKFLALGGDGKLRWADRSCLNHSDFILCGDVDGDGDREIVYDRDGCTAKRGPIVCVDGRTGKLVQQWKYARPGKDHLQRVVLGDFDPSRPGLELAGVGKRRGRGGLILWSGAGRPAWRKDIPAGWVTWGDWDGDGTPEIMPSIGVSGDDGWEVWTGGGKRVYAIAGIGATPLGIESAGRKRPDLDGNGKADVLLWTGRGYIVLMESPSQTRTTISDAQPDGKGLLVHEVESEFQVGQTRVKVLLPENLEKDRRYPVVYVLPVEPQSRHCYGDGLAEFKKIDAHNKYKIICVAPTFSHMPWYADHPTDPAIRQESYFVKVVVPMIERRYPAISKREGRLLLGFSKSGWGAYSLLLRHPAVFDRAVAWDAPLLGRNLMNLDAGPIFGTKNNFDRYRITSLLESNAKQLGKHKRLILLGYDSFRKDHQAVHVLMEQWKIPHHYRDGPRQEHNWHSGWVAEAIRLLVSPTLRSMK